MILPPADASPGHRAPATTDPAATNPLPAIDPAILADLKKLMADDFVSFMRDAMTRTGALLDDLAAAVRAQDPERVYQLAHKLLGGAAQLGAIGLAVHVRCLKTSGESAVLTGADGQLTLAYAQFARYRAAVHESIGEST